MFVYQLESETCPYGYLDFEISFDIERGDPSVGCRNWIDDMQARCVKVHPYEGESYVPGEQEAREINDWFERWMDSTPEGRGVRDRIEERVYAASGR